MASSLIFTLINALGRRFVQFLPISKDHDQQGECDEPPNIPKRPCYYFNRNQYLKVNPEFPFLHLKNWGKRGKGMSKYQLHL